MKSLSELGISSTEIYHNLTFEDLFIHETNPSLEGYDKATITEFGAVAVDTGINSGTGALIAQATDALSTDDAAVDSASNAVNEPVADTADVTGADVGQVLIPVQN